VSDILESRQAIAQVLDDMLAGDGYRAVIRSWPEWAEGHVRIEIVAGDDACQDCLVPKGVLRMVLQDKLAPGLVVDEEDLIYPTDRLESDESKEDGDVSH
jgi:hypothetical protein